MYFHSDTIMFRNIFGQEFPEKINQDYYDDNIIMYVPLEHGDICYIPDTMVNYRQLENSSWNSVNELQKHIINLLDFDIEMQINPGMRQESVMRHLYSIYYVWKHAGDISKEMREKYGAQVEADNLEESRKWLGYSRLGAGKKCKMTLWLGWQLCKFTFVKLLKKLPGNQVNP